MLGVRGAQGPLNHQGSHALCVLFPWGRVPPPPCPCIPIVGPVLSLVAGGEDYPLML